MPIEGEYEPSALGWVRDQVAEYEASGGTRANTLRDTGIPVVVVTMRGASSGKVRKIALMRVEHEGSYALVASYGGRASHPAWYANLVADPHIVIQDGSEPRDFTVRLLDDEVDGEERAQWWERAVAVYPTYADYEVSAGEHGRVIPVFVAEPTG
ncbi:MAG TPA: nitroreductase family deazaflavin-dependent oxidoreductase [Ilumatobacter sp.]|nr:nitroreductase family deazaflavin-dependent oxidoreductase [Ilumatobacter sp.]